MPPTNPGKKTTAKPKSTKRANKGSKPVPTPDPVDDAEDNDERDDDGEEDEGYETAQQEAISKRLLKQLSAGDKRKKAAARKRRARKYDEDLTELKAGVAKMVPNTDETVRQRTKDAAQKLAECLKRRSQLEKKYIDGVEELRQLYLRHNGELLLAMTGRKALVEQVEVTDTEP